MRNGKRLSLLVVVAMLASVWNMTLGFTMPPTVAGNLNQGIYFDEDFEGYASVSDVEGMVSIHANNYQGVSLVDSGDSERGQVIQLNRADTNCGIVADIAPVKQVEISAWMKVGSDSNQRFCLVCFDSTGKYMELLALYPNKNFGTNDGKDAGYDWWSGEKHAINTWYRVKADIDLENDTATYMLYNTAGVKLEEKSYTGVDFISDIAKVRVHNNGSNSGSNYVDDLVVKQKGYTSERVLKNETFEEGNMFVSSNASYPTRTEFDVTRNTTIGIIPYNETGVGQIVGTGNLKDVYEGSVRIGYDLYLSGDGYVNLRNKKDIEIPLLHFSNSKISTVIESGDLGHLSTEKWYHFEHLLDLDRNLQKVKVYNQNGELVASGINEDLNGVDDIELNVGTVEVRNWSAGSKKDIKFDNFKYETCTNRPEVVKVYATDKYGEEIVGLTNLTPAITQITIVYDKMLAASNPADLFSLPGVDYSGSIVGNSFVMTINQTLSDTASYTLKASAEVMDMDGLTTGKEFETVITTGTIEENSQTAPLLVETWDGIVEGWVLNNITEPYLYTVDEAHGKSATMQKVDPEKQGEFTKKFPTQSNGAIKVRYSVIANGNNVYVCLKHENYEYQLCLIGDKDGVYADLSQGVLIADIVRGEWITLEHIVNLDTQSMTTKVFNATGALLATKTEKGKLDFNGTVAMNQVSVFNFRNWGQTEVYFDDIVIEPYSIPPTLSEESVQMTDHFGNALQASWTVTPAIHTISIDFGTRMDESTLSEITIKKENEDAVPFTESFSESIYTMTLTQGLEPDSTYVIFVPATVTNLRGIPISAPFSYEFETNDGKTEVGIMEVKKGGVAITELSQLVQGDTITVSIGYGNITNEPLPVTYVLAYYNGKKMVRMETITATLPTKFGVHTQNFVVGDLTDVEKIKVFVWNGLYDMISYDKDITII